MIEKMNNGMDNNPPIGSKLEMPGEREEQAKLFKLIDKTSPKLKKDPVTGVWKYDGFTLQQYAENDEKLKNDPYHQN